jgi:hypothetical protein
MKNLRLYGAGLLVALLLALAACGTSGGGGGAGTTWTQRTSGTGNELEGVAYRNGLFVAVGQDGTILTSPDGVNWTAQTSGTSNWLYEVAYGNNTFVAVGRNGTILTSPDGVNWTAQTSGTATSSTAWPTATTPSWRWVGTAPSSPPRTG